MNNRDLKAFTVDLDTTGELAAELDLSQALLVAESGIHTRADVEQLQASGARAILVGESLMRLGENIAAKVRDWAVKRNKGGHE